MKAKECFPDLTQEQYNLIYSKLLDKLYKRTKQIQSKANPEHFKSNFFTATPEEIVDEYLQLPAQLRSLNPIYTEAENEELASAYLLCRFICSGVNYRQARNVFRKYFDASWQPYIEHINKEALSEADEKRWGRHLSHVISFSNYRKILEKYPYDKSLTRNQNESSIKTFLEDLKGFYLKNNPTDKNLKKIDTTFEYGAKKGMTRLCKTILEACCFIDSKGGARAYLNEIENTISGNNLSDIEKANKLASDVEKNVDGFGPALSRDFFKDMGYEIFSKPDKHIKEVLGKIFPKKEYPNFNNAEKITCFLLDMAKKLSTEDKIVTAFQLDKVIWLLRSGRFFLHFQQGHQDAYPWNPTKCSKFCKGLRVTESLF